MVRIKDTLPDAQGRSSGRLTGRLGKLQRPPKGESWSWLTGELLNSPAWREMSVNTQRLLSFLLIENQNHSGAENGNLRAPYDQLVEYGLSRSKIHHAIKEACFLGLVQVTFSGGRWGGNNQPSKYRLTFYAGGDASPATNEWKGKTAEAITEWKQTRKVRRKK